MTVSFQSGDVFYTVENDLYNLYKVLVNTGEALYVRAYWPDAEQPSGENGTAFDLRTSCERYAISGNEQLLTNMPVTTEEIRDYETFLKISEGLSSRKVVFEETLRRADLLFEAENWQAAMELYTEAAPFSKYNPMIFDRRGYALLKLGRYGEAIADFEHSLSLIPNGLDTLYNCAQAYFYSGKLEKALEKSEQLIALDAHYENAKELMVQIRAGL